MTGREQRGGESYHRWGGPKLFLGRGFVVCFPLPLCFSLMVAERAFCASDYLNVTGVSHVQGKWQESVGISNRVWTHSAKTAKGPFQLR